MTTVYIYALLDPDSDEVRYVGRTSDLNQRMKQHCSYELKKKTYKAHWVNSLISKGKQPKMLVLEECSEDNWQEAEIRWIAHYKSIARLTNATLGGDGVKTERGSIPRKQVSFRLQPHHIELMNRAAVLLDLTQGEVVEKAIEMFAARKKITVGEGQAS